MKPFLSKLDLTKLLYPGGYAETARAGEAVSPRGQSFNEAVARNEMLREKLGDEVTISTSSSTDDSSNDGDFHEWDKKLLDLTKELQNLNDKTSDEALKLVEQMAEAAMKLESFSAKVTLQHKELVKKQDKALAQNEEIKEGIEDIQEGLEDIQFNLTEGFEGQNAFLNVILREIHRVQGEQHRSRSNQLANHFETSQKLNQMAEKQDIQVALLKKMYELNGKEHARTITLIEAMSAVQQRQWVQQEEDVNYLLAEFEKAIDASFKTALNEQDAKIALSINQKGEDLGNQLACAADILKACHKNSTSLHRDIRQLDGLQDARQSELMTKIEEVLTKKKKYFFGSKS